MATDFSYNGKQIVSGGPFKPSGKDMPSDARTRVESYADIASIPNPHVGLKITVKVDETNNNKMTDYIVKSLKANSIGVANSLIDEVVRYVDYLGVSSSSGGTSSGGNVDLTEYATKTYADNAISTALDGHTFKFLTQAEYDALETKDPLVEYHITDATESGEGLTSEQAQQLQIAYEHSQTTHVQFNDIPTKTSELINDSNFITADGLTGDITLNQSISFSEFSNIESVYDFPDFSNDYLADASNSKKFSLKYEEFLKLFYDPLIKTYANGLTVTKRIVGKDNTGTYNVYEYDIKPKKYTRTILLTSALHPFELPSSFGVAYMINSILKTDNDPRFSYFRENVRIKVIPVLNPWGYNQTPMNYGNNNNVNPNRNFSTNGSWDLYTGEDAYDKKGTAPFSEQETKNIANWIFANRNVAEFWIDCHTGNDYTTPDIWCINQSYSKLFLKVDDCIAKLKPFYATKYGTTEDKITVNKAFDGANNLKLEWAELVGNIPMMVLEQAPLNPKWCPTGRNNDGKAIANYATNLFAFVCEFLKKEKEVFDINDYIVKLQEQIFDLQKDLLNNNYPITTDVNPILPEYELRTNIGLCQSANGKFATNSKRFVTDYIPIELVNNNVIFRMVDNDFICLIRYFDENHAYISGDTNVNNYKGYTVTPPANSKYFVVTGRLKVEADITSSDIKGCLEVNRKINYNLIYDSTMNLTNTVYPKIVTSESSLSINEGSTASINVSLDIAPSSDVTVNITPSSGKATVSPSSLTFTASNYSNTQTVVITGVEDDNDYSDENLDIVLSGENVSSKTVKVTIIDNDENPMPVMVLSSNSLNVNEGSTETFTVCLDKAPSTDIVVTLNVDNSEISLDKNSLTFNSSNYGVAQSVVVTGTDDEDLTNKSSVITLSADGLTTKTINVTKVNTDSQEPTTPSADVVTDGLKLFALTNVNNISGTTITDLSGNGNDLTINKISGGNDLVSDSEKITFDGGQSLTTTLATADSSGTFTLQMVVNSDFVNTTTTSRYLAYLGSSGEAGRFMFNYLNTGLQVQTTSGSTANIALTKFDGQSKKVVLTIVGGKTYHREYQDTTELKYTSAGGGYATSSLMTFGNIVNATTTSRGLEGSIYAILHYHKVLTEEEIAQNVKALL